MKATINIEYSGEELEKFLSNAGVAMLKKLLGSIKIDPSHVPAYIDYFKQGFEQALVGGGFRAPHRWPPQQPFGAAPQDPPPGMSSSYWEEILRQQEGQTGRVETVGDPGEPIQHDRCFPVEASKYIEGGIGCCQCRTYNGTQRTHCRNCGHKLCVIATPPPSPPSKPSGAPE